MVLGFHGAPTPVQAGTTWIQWRIAHVTSSRVKSLVSPGSAKLDRKYATVGLARLLTLNPRIPFRAGVGGP